MKKTKFLSIVTAIVMSISMMCNFVTASAYGIKPGEVIYTYNELLQMSDKEFLSLEYSLIEGGAQGCYNLIDKHSRGDYLIEIGSEYYNKIGGYFMVSTINDFYYRTNYSENLIHELLADSPYGYREKSPINATDDEYYYWYYSITVPEFGLEDNGIENMPEATDENVMKIAKLLYCIRQVCPEFAWSSGQFILNETNEHLIDGDINLDKSINILDAIWISKALIGEFELTETQQKIGDMNSDGKCNIIDAIEISKILMNK